MKEEKLTPRAEFDKALAEQAPRWGFALSGEALARLGDYFELVAAWNPRLHLVAPCPPEEFATRHVLESLAALRFLPEGSTFIDLGSGGGLPAVPCLVAAPDLKAVLFESNKRKSVFLHEAASRLGMLGRVQVVAKRFDKVEPPAADCLTCRAIESFGEILPMINDWASRVPTLLLFGGEGLLGAIMTETRRHSLLTVEKFLLAYSRQRFLYVCERLTPNRRERLQKKERRELPRPASHIKMDLSF